MASDRSAPPDIAAVLWPAPARVRRGPKPRFSVDGITDAAIALADREGLEAVTMQRVAEGVGTTKMALYRHVPGRTELDGLMLDRAMGAAPSLPADDWRAALRSWASHLHDRAQAHPWSVELAQRPHLPGPQELGWFEAGLGATTKLPLSGGERLDTLVLLSGHVLSLVRQEAVPDAEQSLVTAMAGILAERGADYPRTIAAFADPGDRDNARDFGIARILDGVGALIASRSQESTAPPAP